MRLRGWNFLLLLVLNGAYSSSNVILKRFEQCDPNFEYDGNFNITIKTVADKQYADGTLTLKYDLDNTIRTNVSVAMLTGTNYVYMFSINEKKSCDAMHKLLGEFAYELERQAQVIPGMCPLSKGRYHAHNVYLDFTKLTIMQAFPFGNLRLIGYAFNKDNKVASCLKMELEKKY